MQYPSTCNAIQHRRRSVAPSILIDEFIIGGVIPIAGIRIFCEQGFYCLQVLVLEVDIHRAGIVQQIFSLFGAGDRDDMLSLRQYPGNGQLRRRTAPFSCESGKFTGKIFVVFSVLLLITGKTSPEIIIGQLIEIKGIGHQSPGEGTEWDK
jgi:hypothetical protein